MTRDFHNEIDSLRQRDSGLKGVMPKSDPTATAHKWRQDFNALPLPPSVKQIGGLCEPMWQLALQRASVTAIQDTPAIAR